MNKFSILNRIQSFIKTQKDRGEQKKLHNAIETIVEYAKDSRYVKQAKAEMEFAWPGVTIENRYDTEDMEMQKYMCNQIIELLSLLHVQGDSGCSIGYKLNLFNKLAKFDIIKSLTFSDDEFDSNGLVDRGVKQNKRLSSVFLNSDEKNPKLKYSYIYGIFKQDAYIIQSDHKNNLTIVKDDNPSAWSGGAFIIKKDGTLRWSNLKAYIKDTSKFDPNKKYTIPAYSIEYPEAWWISLIFEDDLAVVKNDYYIKESSIHETAKRFKREVEEFKDGRYADEIKRRVDFVIHSRDKNLKNYARKQTNITSKQS